MHLIILNIINTRGDDFYRNPSLCDLPRMSNRTVIYRIEVIVNFITNYPSYFSFRERVTEISLFHFHLKISKILEENSSHVHLSIFYLFSQRIISSCFKKIIYFWKIIQLNVHLNIFELLI